MAFSGDKWKGYRCMTDRRTREDRATQSSLCNGHWETQFSNYVANVSQGLSFTELSIKAAVATSTFWNLLVFIMV